MYTDTIICTICDTSQAIAYLQKKYSWNIDVVWIHYFTSA